MVAGVSFQGAQLHGKGEQATVMPGPQMLDGA